MSTNIKELSYGDLKSLATKYGIEYKGNISKVDLIALLEEYQEDQNNPDIVQSKPDAEEVEDVESIDEETMEIDLQGLELPNRTIKKISKKARAQNRKETFRSFAKRAKDKAMQKRVVVITNNDPRENQHVTTAPLFFENQFFKLDRVVPLNVPVELEQCLIDIARNTPMTVHTPDYNDFGLSSGSLGRYRQAKKYSVSFEDRRR